MRRTLGERRQVQVLCLATDLVLLWAAFHVATLFRMDTLHYVDFALLQRDRVFCMAVFLAAALMLDIYTPQHLTARFDSVYHTLLAVAATGVAQLVLVSLVPEGLRMISRREIILGVLFSFVFLGLWRLQAAGFIARIEAFRRRFVVVGSEREGRRIAETIAGSSWVHAEAEYVPFVQLEHRTKEGHTSARRLPEDAILVVSDEDRGHLVEYKEFCESHFQRTYMYPGLYEVVLFEHPKLLAVAGIPLVQVAGRIDGAPYLHVKRIIDFSAAAFGLLLASPICIAAAIAVKLTSPGGIFYTQERLGRGGRPFKIYKFRTMTAALDARDETGRPIPARKGDARVTPVGKFLRKHRIDEIPQLFNVLRGDMSLVGPRPLWENFFDRINPEERLLVDRRLVVRPGVTSLSHVLGAYDSEHRDRLRYDALYINTLSFSTDLKVLFSTVRIVLSGRGAQ